jgi:hypothetical protein
MRRVIVGAAIVVTATVASLLVLEGAASLSLVALDVLTTRAPGLRPSTRADSVLAWVGKPNYKGANAFGRGIDVATDSIGRRVTPGAGPSATLACSGDSYVFGLGVDDAHPWCALLQQSFAGLSASNLGQLDYGADQSFLLYERDTTIGAPRVHLFALTASSLERAAASQALGRDKPYLAVNGGKLAVANGPVARQSSASLRLAAMGRTFDELQLIRLLRQHPRFSRTQATRDQVEQRWPVVARMLGDLAALDQRRGTALVLVYLPTSRDRRKSGLDAWRDTIAADASRLHVPFVDLTPDLRALRPDSADIAFITTPSGGGGPFVGQYSDVGHAWVARTLTAKLSATPDVAARLSVPAPDESPARPTSKKQSPRR